MSVVCVGQEVEPPSTISLELVKENSSTLVLGLSSDGHLSLDISEYLVPSMHGAELRCIASNGEGSSKHQTKHAEIKLDIIRKLETLVLGSGEFGLLSNVLNIMFMFRKSKCIVTISMLMIIPNCFRCQRAARLKFPIVCCLFVPLSQFPA